MFTFKKLLLAVALAAQLGNVLGAVKIMPLGDSITGSPGCWRSYLDQSLRSSGVTDIDFVGSLSGQSCGLPLFDSEHEGHGGFLATRIAEANQLVDWLASSKPDVVIMHLGTNDVWSNISPATILASFDKLVQQMRASNPNMKILVAQILPMTPANCGDCNARVQAFNAAIAAWAPTRSTTNSPVSVVDQYTGFNTATDTGDGVHPNDNGNKKIAAAWLAKLKIAIAQAAGTGGTPTSTTSVPVTTPAPTPTSTSTPVQTPTTTPSGPAVGAWGQCGGIGHSGGTTCVSGYTCKKSNDWYSQCLPN